MKINPTTNLNDAVKRVADGNIGAASVLAMLVRDHSDTALGWLRAMDKIGMYGHDVWVEFVGCDQNMKKFLISLGDGTMESSMENVRRSRGIK